jgi:N-formylglutamate amidohydrolase
MKKLNINKYQNVPKLWHCVTKTYEETEVKLHALRMEISDQLHAATTLP